MLDSITCDTPISDIIKMADISGDLDSIDEAIESFEKEVTSTITAEQNGGGLSASAFTLNDSPELVNRSNKVVDQMEASKSWKGIRSKIVSDLETQRKAEIARLREKVEEKVEELETEKRNIQDYLDKAASPKKGESYPKVGEYQARLPVLNEELKKYRDKQLIVERMS